MIIRTASWSAPLPTGHVRVGISRGVPRGMTAGYRMFRRLAPGDWFKSVPTEDYLRRYDREVLSVLDPEKVAAELCALVPDHTPVLCCFESAELINAGVHFCHRHLVAQWLEDKLELTVEEVGFPKLDRFAALRRDYIAAPCYK